VSELPLSYGGQAKKGHVDSLFDPFKVVQGDQLTKKKDQISQNFN